MGRDKATLPGPGGAATLLEYVTGVIAQRCEPIFVMAAPGQPLPAVQAQVIRDEVRGQGPLPPTGRGLRAAAQAGARYAFVCAVDMPLLSAALIDDLMHLATETSAEIVLPWDGRSHYLAALYRTDLADRIDGLVAGGARAMRALIDASDAQQIVLPESRFLANVNTESDLLALAQSRS